MTVAAERESHAAPSRRGGIRGSLLGGLAILGMMLALGLLAPLIAPHDPLDQDLTAILAPPSGDHPLGTDPLGRDVLSRLLYATRLDLLIGIGAVIAPFAVGVSLGLVAGYYGGKVDSVISAGVDMVMAFPYYVLIIALVFSLGPGVPSIFIAMALVAWVSYTRIVRSEVLSARGQEYVLAARALGYSDARILFRHILPNVIAQPIAFAMGDIVVIIVGVVTLSFLGLGVPPPTADWGAMISTGQSFLTTHWHLSTIPGLAAVLAGVAFSMVGDGINQRMRVD
jgi:peptide/nickel transport system permease protein